MYILGISAFYHDSAATLIKDGAILAAAQEERFTRKKHDPGFPTNAVKYCLDEAGIELSALNAVVFYDKPLLKFERLLETYYAFVPKGLRSFITAMPVWIKEKMFLKRLIKEELAAIGDISKTTELLFPEHHLSHAASAYYVSPFKKAAILTIDGVGEWATASICLGENEKISILKELRFPHSLGLLYSAFTYFLGFRVNSGEYKLMGLAPYGNPGAAETERYVKLIKEQLISIKPDGSIWLDQDYFDYATGLKMVNEAKWENLFGMKTRKPEDALESHHCNLGLAIQQVTEEIVVLMAQEAQRLTGADAICLAGGVALNCVANGKLQKSGVFKNVFIQPAAGDAGGALGAALAAYHIYYGKERVVDASLADAMKGSYLGPDILEHDVAQTIKKYKATAQKFESIAELTNKAAELLAAGNVVGWVQGRMEFGPRALGARSILGDSRSEEMQKKLNVKIKYRESFRPFAPSVLAEDVAEYFEYEGTSPYMLLVHPVTKSRRKTLPDGYDAMDLRNKLYHLRSDMPAITHIDFSARIQTVHKETNPRYWELINAFKQKTGYGVVVNTSFNVRGEPIVSTPNDAYRCFMRTEMDYLVVGNYIFNKTEQPSWTDTDNWKEEFTLD